jgi:hypothetical protein
VFRSTYNDDFPEDLFRTRQQFANVIENILVRNFGHTAKQDRILAEIVSENVIERTPIKAILEHMLDVAIPNPAVVRYVQKLFEPDSHRIIHEVYLPITTIPRLQDCAS